MEGSGSCDRGHARSGAPSDVQVGGLRSSGHGTRGRVRRRAARWRGSSRFWSCSSPRSGWCRSSRQSRRAQLPGQTIFVLDLAFALPLVALTAILLWRGMTVSRRTSFAVSYAAPVTHFAEFIADDSNPYTAETAAMAAVSAPASGRERVPKSRSSRRAFRRQRIEASQGVRSTSRFRAGVFKRLVRDSRCDSPFRSPNTRPAGG